MGQPLRRVTRIQRTRSGSDGQTQRAPHLDISVDGGINLATAVACVRAGANILIAGTHLYRMTDMAAGVQQLRAACSAATHA